MSTSSRSQLLKYADKMDNIREERIKMAFRGQLSIAELSRDEKVQLAGLQMEYKRRRGLKDFNYFCKRILGYQDMADMHKELCTFVTGKGKRKLILEPRGSFKSSVVTIGYPLWRHLHDPNIRILIDSEEFGKSKAFMRELRDHVTHNDEFRRLYGELDKKKYTDIWQEHQFNLRDRVIRRKETNFSSAGVDVTKVGMHYDLIICDDLVSDKNITTPEQLDKVYKHYQLLLSLLDPGCEMIIIGTRWHFADLYGRLLEEDQARKAKGKKPIFRKLIRSAIKKNGTLLFPERLTKGFLSSMKTAQGSYIFSCQYLNDPAGAEDAAFRGEWVQWYTELPKGVPLNFCILVDPSVGQSKESDNSAIVSVAVDPLYNWHVLSVDRGHWNPTQLIKRMVDARRRLFQRYGKDHPNTKDVKIALEVVAFQMVLKHYAKDLMRRREIEKFKIIELKTDTRVSKEMRIRGLVPFFENNQIHFKGISKNKCEKGIRTLYDELLQFPVGRTKDCLDALAYVPQIARIPEPFKQVGPSPNALGRIRERMKKQRDELADRDVVVGSRFNRGGEPWQQN